MERKIDLRVAKTRNAIKSAFREMILEMDASRISISGLGSLQLFRLIFQPCENCSYLKDHLSV